MPKRKRSKLQILKDKAWNRFSIYIRLKYSDINGLCECITCGRKHFYIDMDAGHFIDSRCNSVLLNEDLVRPQCDYCNRHLHGNKVAYTLYMINERGYTKEDIENMYKLKFEIRKFTEGDLQEKIDYYNQEIDKYLKEKNI